MNTDYLPQRSASNAEPDSLQEVTKGTENRSGGAEAVEAGGVGADVLQAETGETEAQRSRGSARTKEKRETGDECSHRGHGEHRGGPHESGTRPTRFAATIAIIVCMVVITFADSRLSGKEASTPPARHSGRTR